MGESKCIRVLKTLTKSQLNTFEAYLNALYSRKKKIIALFSYLKRAAPRYVSERIRRGFVIQNGLNGEKVTGDNLDGYLTGLLKILEEFLLWQKMKKTPDDFHRHLALLDIYKERELPDLYESRLSDMEKKLEKSNVNMWTYLQKMQLAKLRYYNNPNCREYQRGEYFKSLMENLDGFFISAKLKYACEQVYRKKTAGLEYRPELLKASRALASSPPHDGDPLMQIYRLIIALEANPDKVEDYYQLKELIFEHYHRDEPSEKHFYFSFLMNYISGQIKRANTGMRGELKDLLDFGINSGIILDNEYIQPVVFTNYIHVACQLLGSKAAVEIKLTLQQHLNPEDKEEAMKIAEGEINFTKGDYQAIIDNLERAVITPGILNLQRRLLVLKAHYELGDAENYIEATRKYIRRAADLSGENLESLQNTLKYMHRLLDPNIKKEVLRREIEQESFLFNRSWLLSKI